MNIKRILLASFFGGGGLLLIEYLAAYFIPTIGILFWLPTIVALAVLEDFGLSTLHDSPDGWPIATEVGIFIAAALWWAFWSIAIIVVLRKSRV